MELEREGKTNIVFLDACRDNPLARNLARSMGTRSASVGRGLAQVQTGVGTFIAYSTQPGNVALDGSGRNSPFTAALAKGVREPGRNLTAVMIDVRKEVLERDQRQAGAVGPLGADGRFLFPPRLRAGRAAENGARAPARTARPCSSGCGSSRSELKKKSDPQQTAKLVELAQLKERLRQIEEANRADQQRIFETYRKYPASDPGSRASVSREVGAIQMQMVRRNEDRKKLSEQIAKLEAEVGLVQGGEAK